jgi:hypothetical protein
MGSAAEPRERASDAWLGVHVRFRGKAEGGIRDTQVSF